MLTLDLLVSNKNNYKSLLNSTEKHFNISFYKYSNYYADAFNDETKIIVSATPSKLSFMLPDQSNFTEFITEVESYLNDNFQHQLVGFKCSNPMDSLIISPHNVKMVEFR